MSRQGRNDEPSSLYSRAIQLESRAGRGLPRFPSFSNRKARSDAALAASTTATQLMRTSPTPTTVGVARRERACWAERSKRSQRPFGSVQRMPMPQPTSGALLPRVICWMTPLRSSKRAPRAARLSGDLQQSRECMAAGGGPGRGHFLLSESVEIEPGYVLAHSNLLYALHGHPDYDAADLLAEHRRWNEEHARHLRPNDSNHDNDPSSDRRLRIGYVSPDFRRHPVGFFVLPLFAAHDRRQFEVFCYSDVAAKDEVTDELALTAGVCDGHRRLSDERVAALVATIASISWWT